MKKRRIMVEKWGVELVCRTPLALRVRAAKAFLRLERPQELSQEEGIACAQMLMRRHTMLERGISEEARRYLKERHPTQRNEEWPEEEANRRERQDVLLLAMAHDLHLEVQPEWVAAGWARLLVTGVPRARELGKDFVHEGRVEDRRERRGILEKVLQCVDLGGTEEDVAKEAEPLMVLGGAAAEIVEAEIRRRRRRTPAILKGMKSRRGRECNLTRLSHLNSGGGVR
jgi:hypothetical protein